MCTLGRLRRTNDPLCYANVFVSQSGAKAITMTAFFKPASAPVAKGKLPGEEEDDDDGREGSPAADEEEEENLDDI